jgi:pimeloyl-ACP methyl ester carboxylesterase
MPRLADEGYRVVAPAMRGYGLTGPAADGRYDTQTLGQDAIDLHKALDGSRPGVLIGHDWGADAVYAALRADPGRWSAAVAASDPPMAERPVDLVNPAQLRRSWYSHLLQFPIGARLLRDDEFALVAGLWADWSPGYDAGEGVHNARAALAPGGLRGSRGPVLRTGRHRATFRCGGSQRTRSYARRRRSTAVPTRPPRRLHRCRRPRRAGRGPTARDRCPHH